MSSLRTAPMEINVLSNAIRKRFFAFLPFILSTIVSGIIYFLPSLFRSEVLLQIVQEVFKLPALTVEAPNLSQEPGFATKFITSHVKEFAALMAFWFSYKICGQRKSIRDFEYRIRYPLPDFADWPREYPKYDLLSPFRDDSEFRFRKKELKILRQFAEAGSRRVPSIKFVVGCEGIGKTRLVHETLWLLTLNGWQAGWVKVGTTAEEIRSAKIKDRTCLAIDNSDEYHALEDVLLAICEKQSNIRIFVIGEVFAENRFNSLSRVSDKLAGYYSDALYVGPMSSSEIDSIKRPSIRRGPEEILGRPLYALMDDDYEKLVAERADRLISRAQTQNAKDILLVAALAGPIERTADLAAANLTADVSELCRLFTDKNRDFLKEAFPRVEPPVLADHLVMKLADQKGNADLERLFEICVAHNAVSVEVRLGRLWTRGLSRENGFDVRSKLQNTFDRTATHRVTQLHADARTALATLLRFSHAFDAEDQARVQQFSQDYQGRRQKITAQNISGIYQIADLDAFDLCTEFIEKACTLRPRDAFIRQVEIETCALAVKHYCHTAKFLKHIHWVERLKTMGVVEIGNQGTEATLAYGAAMVEVVKSYARMVKPHEALKAYRHLADFVELTGSVDPKLKLLMAMAVVHALASLGKDACEDSRRLIVDIERLSAHGFENDAGYLIQKAGAYLNYARILHESGEHEAAKFYLAEIKNLHRMPQIRSDPYLVAIVVQAYVNSVFASRYGRLDAVDQEFNEVLSIWETWRSRANSDIASRVGEVVVNASHAYANANQVLKVEKCYRIAVAITAIPQFRNDIMVKQQVARVLVNLTDVHGKIGDIKNVDETRIECRKFFEVNRDFKDTMLAVKEAQCCVNLMRAYGELHAFDKLEIVGDSVTRLAASAFMRIQAVNEAVFSAAENAVTYYGKAGIDESSRRQRWQDCIRTFAATTVDGTIERSVATYFGS